MRSVRGRVGSRIGVALLVAFVALALASCFDVTDPGQWSSLTPTNESVVLALLDDPFDHNFVYAGTSEGQVYRAYAANRADGVAGAGIPANAVVSSLAADTKTPRLIYAGTSDGFYASVDRGEHWALRGSGLPSDDTVDALAVATPANVLFAGTTAHGIYTSSDAGQTWNPAESGLPASANINALFWEPLSQTLYAAVDGVGVFASGDNGASWTSRSAGLSTHPFAFVARYAATATETTTATATSTATSTVTSTTTLYVGTDKGISASVDGGLTWTSLGFAHRVLSLALDPQHPTWIYAGTDSDVYRSRDDGKTWSSLAPGIQRSVSSLLAVVPTGQQTVLYAGAGPLLRYPPYPSNSNDSPVLGTVLLVALFLVIFYIFWRNRRRMIEADRRLPLGMHPEGPKAKEPESVERYINIMTPPTPRDGQRQGGTDTSHDAGNGLGHPDDFTDIEN